MAAVGRIIELGEARRAGRQVRSDHDPDRRARAGARVASGQLARLDEESAAAPGLHRLGQDGMNLRGRRAFLLQPGPERGDPVVGPLEMDDHPLGRILDPARKPEHRRQPDHERPEPDPLHSPQDPQPNRRGGRARGPPRIGFVCSRHNRIQVI